MPGLGFLRSASIVVAAAILAGHARANDSSSVLAAGGLVLVKTDAISIEREDLTLSPRQVRVRYEMRNKGASPVALRVAFPLPELPVDTPGGLDIADRNGEVVAHAIDLPTSERPNFLGFAVWANGKYVEPEVEVRALLPDGRNIAAELREIGGWSLVTSPRLLVDIADLRSHVGARYDVGPSMLRQLRALGAIAGTDAAWAAWKTYVTFHWLQTFAPGVTIIEHRYLPAVGRFLFNRSNGTWVGGAVGEPDNLDKAYCIDKTTSRALDNLASQDRNGYLNGVSLAYILTTGANWSGPIRTFHLTVDGQTPPPGGGKVRTLSLCSEMPLRQTAPMRLEGTVRDYVPNSDLRVLMAVSPPP